MAGTRAAEPIGQATVADALVDLSPSEIARLTDLLQRVKARLVEMADAGGTSEIEWPDEIVDGDLTETRVV